MQIGSKGLKIYSVKAHTSKTSILFLSGGSIDVGKERYETWQDSLAFCGISSVSFDYSGVHGSGTPLKESSLKSRIEESEHVTDWMIKNIPADQYALYGVSMGGYIALGLINERPNIFQKLILQTPAAYAPTSHDLRFGTAFTKEIKKSGWSNSFSFAWLAEYNKSVLFIEAEKDEIIPKHITKKYQNLKEGEQGLKNILLNESLHSIWQDTPQEVRLNKEVYEAIVNFIDASCAI